MKIKIPVTPNASKIIDSCFDILMHIDSRYNSYTTGSDFNRVNLGAGGWVKVDNNTIRMLEELEKIRQWTGGIYNIQVMPLLKRWGFYKAASQALPGVREIRPLLALIQQSTIETKNNNVKVTKGCEIITGSFIKAYAVDRVVDFLKSEGVTDAIINAGGSTIYALNNDEHPSWRINIPHPSVPNSHWAEIALQNACLSLSGRKNHFIEIDNRQYGHIINARTGYPSSNQQAVTITQSAFAGDILSTALMANDSNPAINKTIERVFKGQLSYYVVAENTPAYAPAFITC